ncbi:MAG: exodeoxyribonuclease I, partial [Pseudomonadales bacterium]|nr:exodeoxyribonuclease I [Pseudomonadales bacterium]
TEFIGRIHDEFARPGTCVAGFNSIRFDDEFTRNILYRNFLEPYAREWQGGNSRWDVIDLFRLAQALRPDGMNWPRNEDGNPSFRLEHLTAANGISHENAHDAVADVLATVELVKRLKAAQPKLYDYAFNLRGKRAVLAQLYPLGKQALVHASSMYSSARQCIAVVLPLCTQPGNPNGVVCYDLAFDPGELVAITPEELHRRVFTPQQELDADRIHLKTIHVNRCPAVAPLATLRTEDAARLDIDLEACRAHMKSLQQASGVVEKIQDAFARGEFARTDDPDLMLYQGDFFSNSDRARMAELRNAPPASLPGYGNEFEDPRVPEMLFRYRARNFPDSLSDVEMRRWIDYRRSRWIENGRASATLSDIDRLLAEPAQEGKDKSCLVDLKSWIDVRLRALQ